MISDKDPIVAIATASGRGGVGIIRLSGDDTHMQAFLRDFFAEDAFKPRYAYYRKFKDAAGDIIDEGLVLYFPAPKSYTGESVVELQSHGGSVVLQMMLKRVLEVGNAYGLRLAEPGEFTKRAFLNGRMDLSQAEAVADLVDATTEGAARAASRSLTGQFSNRIATIGDDVVELRALIEAILDFPEEEIDFIESTQARARIQKIKTDFEELKRLSKQGSILRDGVTVVLVGSPNVGKSSLMNCLSGSDVAIVTDVAGTTRDKIEHDIQIDGVVFRLVDTAGVRETEDKVEVIGIERTLQAINNADIVLHLMDLSSIVSDEEGQRTLEKVMQHVRRGVPVIDVYNKSDVVDCGDKVSDALYISAKTGIGIDALKSKLLDLVGWERNTESVFLARERHLRAIAEADEHLRLAETFIEMNTPALDLLAEELRLTNDALGEIIGTTTPDDLLGMIFSRFCIGK